ncbi:MAG: hypothetical protein ABI761_16475 [Saprospiraceae bacterium]
MNTPQEIEDIAMSRIEEADILVKAGRSDGAFYLLGYAVELMLKNKLCRLLDIPDLFKEIRNGERSDGLSDLRRPFMIHTLKTLIKYCGLQRKLASEMETNTMIRLAISLLFESWSEDCRYKPCGYCVGIDVQILIDSVKNPGGLIEWIRQN